MRKVGVVGILLFTLLSVVFASASSLRVDGGTIQMFTYKDVAPDGGKLIMRQPAQTLTPSLALSPTLTLTLTPTLSLSLSLTQTPTPPPSATPIWDGSLLEFTSAGFSCEDGYRLFADAANTGKTMREPSEWKLLLERTEITVGKFPALGANEKTRLEYLVTDAGTYRFVIFQHPGFPGDPVLTSPEINVDPALCSSEAVEPTLATATPEVLPTGTPEPTASPTQTETPEPTAAPPVTATPTETPSPTETPPPTEAPLPTETPTATPEPTIEVIVVEPPTNTPVPQPDEPTATPTAPIEG